MDDALCSLVTKYQLIQGLCEQIQNDVARGWREREDSDLAFYGNLPSFLHSMGAMANKVNEVLRFHHNDFSMAEAVLSEPEQRAIDEAVELTLLESDEDLRFISQKVESIQRLNKRISDIDRLQTGIKENVLHMRGQ